MFQNIGLFLHQVTEPANRHGIASIRQQANNNYQRTGNITSLT